MLQVHQFPYYEDNYGYLVHCAETGETIAMDAGDCQPYLDAARQMGWNITQIWITHHHWDHTDGLTQLKQAADAKVFGPRRQSVAIPQLDVLLDEGNVLIFGGQEVKIIETPGHTLDMINFYFPKENKLFVGDTIMSLGCGRVIEGTRPMMWKSLEKLVYFPKETIIYSCHEYGLLNASFAMTIDVSNSILKSRVEEIKALRAQGKPSVPSTLEQELATNPFLRAQDKKIREHLNMENATDAEVFAEIRTRRDNF